MLIYIHGQGLVTKIKQKCNNLYIRISRLEASVKCHANNYRPISLLSSFNKILFKQITNFLQCNDVRLSTDLAFEYYTHLL